MKKSDAEVRFFGTADQRLAEATLRGKEIALLYRTLVSELIDVVRPDSMVHVLALDLTKHSLNLDVWTKRPPTPEDPPPTMTVG